MNLNRIALILGAVTGASLVGLAAHAANQAPLTVGRAIAAEDKDLCADVETTPAEIERILLDAFKPYVRSTLRPVTFYSYGGEVDATAEQFFRANAASHFNTIQQGSELGNGIYSDSDPIATMGYSRGDHPQVLRIGVPAGIGYLDQRNRHREIPANAGDVRKVFCFERSVCDSDACRNRFDMEYKYRDEKKAPSIDTRSFLFSSRSQVLLKRVYDQLGIRFIASGFGLHSFQECTLDPNQRYETEAIFIDPNLAPRLKLDILVPHPDHRLSRSEKAVYADFLGYLDSFHFQKDAVNNGFDIQRNQAFDPEGKEVQHAIALFMSWYSGVAAAVHNLPASTDFMALHRRNSEAAHATRPQVTTSKMFGCSPDPRYRDEAFPPK